MKSEGLRSRRSSTYWIKWFRDRSREKRLVATAWLKKCGLAQNPWERTVQVSCDAVLVSRFSQVKQRRRVNLREKGKFKKAFLRSRTVK